jgi:hypothetical protein
MLPSSALFTVDSLPLNENLQIFAGFYSREQNYTVFNVITLIVIILIVITMFVIMLIIIFSLSLG